MKEQIMMLIVQIMMLILLVSLFILVGLDDFKESFLDKEIYYEVKDGNSFVRCESKSGGYSISISDCENGLTYSSPTYRTVEVDKDD